MSVAITKQARRVVITGLGPLCSLGIGKAPVWENLLHKKTNLELHTEFIGDDEIDSYHIHKVNDFDVKRMDFSPETWRVINEKQEGLEDMDFLYLLTAVHLALRDSRLTYDWQNNQIGLVLTHENPGMDRFLGKILQLAGDVIKDTPRQLQKMNRAQIADYMVRQLGTNVYEMQTFIYLFFIAKAMGIHGYSLFINNACASGLFAIEAAAQHIHAGTCPAVVVAAGDYPLFFTKYLWFKQMGLYAKDGLMKPFSKNRNGIVFGDGAAAVVMEDREHAISRGATIYAEYLSGGFSLEGGHIVIPNLNSRYYHRALTYALHAAGITTGEVDLLCPHGVSTSIGDRYEAQVITDVFGKYQERPFITAFKPYVGHNLGGSALIETILLLLALHYNTVPPTINCDEPDPKLGLEPVRGLINIELTTAVKISNGFAGYDSAAVFRKNME
jgi:3-oxoacyl-(acyl-carrier-protein) synthase